MFSLGVKFNDGTQLAFRIDQGVALGNSNGDALKIAEEGARIAAEGGRAEIVVGAAVALTGLIMYACQNQQRGTLKVIGNTTQHPSRFRADGQTLYVDIF